MLRPSEPRVKVCRTSTKWASSGERRLWACIPSKSGPAGSRPTGGDTNTRSWNVPKTLRVRRPPYFLTSYSSNFIGGVASSKSCNVGPEAVANQVDVLQRHVGGFLRGNNKLKNVVSLA